MNRWVPVGIALVTVLAGCMAVPTAAPGSSPAPATPTQAPETPATPTTGTTQTTEPGTDDPAGTTTGDDGASPAGTAIDVRGGTLPVDPDGTFDRLRRIVDANASPPGYVVALTAEDVPNGSGGVGGGSTPTFRAAMGMVPRPNESGSLRYRYPAMTSSVGVASVYPGEKPPGLVETILAHELVHYLQFAGGDATELRRELPVGTTDGSFVYRSVLEGTAVYVTDAYVDRHVDGVGSNSRLYQRIENVTPPGTPGRYGNSWYVFGGSYADSRLDSPTETERLVESPPRTSEQVIHGYAPGVEPPRSLSVSVAPGGNWSAIGSDRMGEAFLRVALQNGLPVPRADRVATGWGNDSLRTFRSGDSVGYAWTIRWDDAGNATEAETGFERYLDSRGNRSGSTWTVDGNHFDLRRPSPETTVLILGDRSFVTGTSVVADDGSVELAPPGSRTPNGTTEGQDRVPVSRPPVAGSRPR